MRTTTNPLSSSTISFTLANNFWTNFPDSENHFENKLCELISTNLPRAYRSDSLIANFCARARQSEVFPVPGGPCRRTTRFQVMMLKSTSASENKRVV